MAKKKGFDKNAKGFLLGRLLPGLGIISLAVALAFLLRGLLDAEQMWLRMIGIVTVLGIGFGGFFYILVGTPGLALGFGVILILALVYGLSQPWKGLLAVALTGLMLLPGLCAKRRDAEEPNPPRARESHPPPAVRARPVKPRWYLAPQAGRCISSSRRQRGFSSTV